MAESQRITTSLGGAMVELILDGSVLGIEGSQGPMFSLDAFFSGLMGPGMGFGSAHYEFSVLPHIPENLAQDLCQAIETNRVGRFRKQGGFPKMDGAMREIIEEETSLDLGKYRMYATCMQTRKTIRTVLTSIAKRTNKPIALPVPNWHFWNMCGDNPEKIPFTYFDATNAKELVEGFDMVSRSGDVGSLVLTSPANPLLYDLSREDVAEIDRIAATRNVKVIIDDVLRGTKPLGQRDSIASWFEKPPYVIEGFGKRFGEGALAGMSYVLVPRGEKVAKPQLHWICNSNSGVILRMAHKYATEPALKELEARNAAFDKGLLAAGPQGLTVTRPYQSSLISLVSLPADFPMSSQGFAIGAHYRGIEVAPMDVFYPPGHRIPTQQPEKIRVTVGHFSSDSIQRTAGFLGNEIKLAQEYGRPR